MLECDLGTKILALVIEFAHDDESEEKRIAAAELLHLLAPIVGPVLARDYVLSEVESLSQDHAFRVRKAVALHFDSSFDSKLPIKYHTKLMKTYINLCRDEAWVVRRYAFRKWYNQSVGYTRNTLGRLVPDTMLSKDLMIGFERQCTEIWVNLLRPYLCECDEGTFV